MTLIGVGATFVAAAAADVAGDEQTQGFTRPAWVVTTAVQSGLSIDGLASWSGDVIGLAGSLL